MTINVLVLCTHNSARSVLAEGITGALVDGPLAFDNAVSMAAARTNGIESRVAADADILVVLDLESGNSWQSSWSTSVTPPTGGDAPRRYSTRAVGET